VKEFSRFFVVVQAREMVLTFLHVVIPHIVAVFWLVHDDSRHVKVSIRLEFEVLSQAPF
jgi:hypothetical protein